MAENFNAPAKKSSAHELMIEGFQRMNALDRATNVRGIAPFSRYSEANTDWHQLPVKSSEFIVDTDGVPFFIVGLSIVGGGDRVRP